MHHKLPAAASAGGHTHRVRHVILSCLLLSACGARSAPAQLEPRCPEPQGPKRTQGSQSPTLGAPEAPRPEATPEAQAQTKAPRPAAPGAPPGRVQALAVPGFRASLVWVPAPATHPRPLLVVAHGAGGAPEPHCKHWQRLVSARGFLLCLRGKIAHAAEGRFYYPNHHWLGHALDSALHALEQRYGAAVDTRHAAYSGYSQGANMGVLAVQARQERFARLLLVESQQNDWSVRLAQAWHQAGGQRLGIACGLALCWRAAQRSAWIARRGGLEVQLRYAAGAGHTYLGAVAEQVQVLFEWLIADDPRWHTPTSSSSSRRRP